MYIFTRFGSRRLKFSRELLKKIGVYPIRDHYYFPLFKDSKLKKSLREPRYLPGIDFCEKKQLLLLERFTFSKELKLMKLNEKTDKIRNFHLNNGAFESGDAEFLYQFIRFFKPKNVIEIGSGYSTKIANNALLRNKSENKKSSSPQIKSEKSLRTLSKFYESWDDDKICNYASRKNFSKWGAGKMIIKEAKRRGLN